MNNLGLLNVSASDLEGMASCYEYNDECDLTQPGEFLGTRTVASCLKMDFAVCS